MKNSCKIIQTAKLENLPQLIGPVLECARECGLDRTRCGEVELVVEEAWANICSYAYPEGNGGAELHGKTEKGRLVIEIIDAGIPFDLTSHADPDLNSSLEHRDIGGLGVALIKQLTDEIHYRRENGKNILTLVFLK